MKNILIATMLLISGLFTAAAGEINVIPRPAKVDVGTGTYTVPRNIGVKGADKASQGLAKEVIETLTMTGQEASGVKKGGDITVKLNPELGKEEYKLSVNHKGIEIEAATATGGFYAVQTLVQMIDADTVRRTVPICKISDFPRLEYRGLMLDVVRCYIPANEIKKFIDMAARLKLNSLHLHLTDDNGWRLEIKKYPKLTEVGAWRVDRPELFPGRLNQRNAEEPTPVGGYYTQDEMRELVKYAAERHVNIVPEIEMPAHAAAAIASYPELACEVNDKFVGVFPGIGGKDASIIMCAGNDKVYDFYQDVLSEVMEIFPSPMINLGGDEANKTLWNRCALCQERIRTEGLADSEELQGYFMDRINAFVRSKGRTAMGWDEVTYGNPKEDIVVFGWQGDGTTAVDYSRRTGRRFIMTPAKTTYLIRYQGPQWFEPWTYFGNNRLSDIYHYEPVGDDWTPELERSMIGLQGSLWSEFCKTADDMQYLVFPRLMAVADVAWTPKGAKNWPRFLESLDMLIPTLDKLGIDHAESMWNVQHTLTPNGDGTVSVDLQCERPDAQVMYSLADSALSYPFSRFNIAEPGIIYASTMKDGERRGKLLQLPLNFNLATGREVVAADCSNGLSLRLTNGLRGSTRNSDFEWAGWHNRTAEFTIDLGEVQSFGKVSLGTLINSDICVLAPDAIQLAVSENGVDFMPVSTVKPGITAEESHPVRIVDIELPVEAGTHARYLKISATNPGVIPDGMAREGSATWLYFDEVIVE